MHSHTRRTLMAHFDVHDLPIMESAICCCCEDDAGRRMASYKRAKDHGEFESSPRQPIAEGVCVFCRRVVRAKASRTRAGAGDTKQSRQVRSTG